MRKTSINILSITGGGIRGLITLYVLRDLEKQLSKPIHSHFEYITGTSTGAIIASLLSCGYSVQDIIDMYEIHGPLIFKKSFLRFGVFRPKYDDSHLNSLIHGALEGKELHTNLIIPSYNASKREKHIFKSYGEDDRDVSLFDIVRSSASAPSYFKPVKIKGDYYIDGGLVINNPSFISYIEAFKFMNSKASTFNSINLFSFGTGRMDNEIEVKSNGGGKLFWVKPTIDVLLNEQAKITDHYLSRMFKFKGVGNYFNIEPVIEFSSSKIDDTSKRNMDRMKIDGEISVTRHEAKIRKIAKILNND